MCACRSIDSGFFSTHTGYLCSALSATKLIFGRISFFFFFYPVFVDRFLIRRLVHEIFMKDFFFFSVFFLFFFFPSLLKGFLQQWPRMRFGRMESLVYLTNFLFFFLNLLPFRFYYFAKHANWSFSSFSCEIAS